MSESIPVRWFVFSLAEWDEGMNEWMDEWMEGRGDGYGWMKEGWMDGGRLIVDVLEE